MSTMQPIPSERRRSSIFQQILVAILTAIVANLIIFFIAQGSGTAITVPGPDGVSMVLPLPVVIMMSVLPAVAAVGLLVILRRFSTSFLRIFQIIAAIMLGLSFIPLFTLPIEAAARPFLIAMHLLTAVAIVGSLTFMLSREEQ